MALNIEEQTDAIIQANKGHENSWHIWLYGFHKIIEESELNIFKVENYLDEISKDFSQFTKLSSGSQLMRIFNAYLNEFDFRKPLPLDDIKIKSRKVSEAIKLFGEKPFDIYHAFLPVDNSHHLEFPIIKADNTGKFVYTICNECKDQDPHGFPEIYLRKSLDFSNNPNAKKSIQDGTFMLETRVDPKRIDKELIIQSYKSFEEFINRTRI